MFLHLKTYIHMCVCVYTHTHTYGFPGGSVVKKPPANAGASRDTGSIPGWGISPGGGNGNPLQYSCQYTEEPRRLQSIGLQRVRQD